MSLHRGKALEKRKGEHQAWGPWVRQRGGRGEGRPSGQAGNPLSQGPAFSPHALWHGAGGGGETQWYKEWSSGRSAPASQTQTERLPGPSLAACLVSSMLMAPEVHRSSKTDGGVPRPCLQSRPASRSSLSRLSLRTACPPSNLCSCCGLVYSLLRKPFLP